MNWLRVRLRQIVTSVVEVDSLAVGSRHHLKFSDRRFNWLFAFIGQQHFMCGITGLFLTSPTEAWQFEPRQVLQNMNLSIAHRGPDADGFFLDEQRRCFLGHRRLSVIDLSSAGAQPMQSQSGRWIVSFNGEIYNYRDFASELESLGIRLRGHSDTEILVNLLDLYGPNVLQRIDGMFAFAAFDVLSGDLLLARDAFGEKPLYFTQRDGYFAFASELTALEKIPNFSRIVDLGAIAELLMFQYIGAPRTIYPHVNKLLPGTWMRISTHGVRTEGRHFSFRPGQHGFSVAKPNELVDELDSILTDSLRRRLISDVPLGAFLSGGVDSSVTAALAVKRLGIDLQTFSMGFENAVESEHETARAFAKHLGTNHREEIVSPDVQDFLVNVGGILDEPNVDSSCLPTWLLSRFARQRVTVAISGDGGDELFGGYGRYSATLNQEQINNTGFLAGEDYYSGRILVMDESAMRRLLGKIPDPLSNHLAMLRSQVSLGAEPLLCRLRRTDVENYMPGAVLPKVDRMSMQHSLEVRTPFLNRDLARFAEKLPQELLINAGVGKWLLRQVGYRYLPKELIDLPKKGFALPLSDWGKVGMMKQLNGCLGNPDNPLRKLFGAKRSDRFLRDQSSDFAPFQAWGIAVLDSWIRIHEAKVPESESDVGRRFWHLGWIKQTK